MKSEGAAVQLFAGGGEMHARCRELDWSATPLGAVEGWSIALRTTARMVLDSRNPMFLFWGPDAVQLYNDAYRPSLGEGGRHPRALGMKGREFWTEIWSVIGPQIDGVMTRGAATWFENQYLPIERNGAIEDVWWTYSYSPVRDDDDSIGGTLVVCQETTSRVLAEQRLRELNDALGVERTRLDEAFQKAPSFMTLLRTPDFRFELANEAYYRLLGRRDIVGKTLLEALPELASQGFEEILEDVVASGLPFVGKEVAVVLQRTPDAPAEERFVDFIYQPLRALDGSVVGVLTHGNDVTEHVLARRELEIANERLLVQARELAAQSEALHDTAARLEVERENADFARRSAEAAEARFRAVFEKATVAIAVLEGPAHVYSLVSPSYAALTGHRPLLGRALLEALPELRDQEIPTLLDQAYATGLPIFLNERVVRIDRDGDGVPEEYFFDVRYAPLRNASGQVYAVASAAVDVTGQVRARRVVEAARAAAEEANQAKTDFLTTMSHELRTPLNAIAGYTELLDLGIHGPVSDEQHEALHRIQRSQRHLLGLINDVLNFAKLEAGHVEFHIGDVRVRDVIDALEPLVAPQISAKSLRFDRAECADGRIVRADPDKLQQILVNLLSNAVKFTAPGGSIRMICETHETTIAIAVEDTGVGIASDRLEHVFAPFVQIDRRLSSAHEGTGLGLAISRDLARGMQGDLTVESRLGAGSRFTLTLPRSTPTP